MPYNYLLHPTYIKKYSDILVNSIILFDEGHNVEKVAEEGKYLI